MNLHAGRGVAVREVSLKTGYGEADYILFVNRKAVGVVEAKPRGTTLKGVELQSSKYSAGLPEYIDAPVRPLPFLYESTGVETQFTNGLDPEPRSRRVFAFHSPSALADWAGVKEQGRRAVSESSPVYDPNFTLRARLKTMPALSHDGLWPAQWQAITNLEQSLAQDKPRALIQMATGSGKTITAISSIYRLIKYADAKRVLFLVDRSNLGKQTLKEFQNWDTPDDHRKFTELYNAQYLQSSTIDDASRVCISTIQRLFALLKGEELNPELEDASQSEIEAFYKQNDIPISFNPRYPIDTFDFIVIDEAHRSIYNLWRQVLEYFDAYLIGLTATPSKQTFGFFNQNLVMEYGHHQAVGDGVNVGYDIYKIRTKITESGSTVEAENYIDRRDRLTRKKRWEQLDEDFSYAGRQLDRDVVATDQIRTIIQTFKDRLFTEIFPGRKEVPKTLIFAKDDSHADDIVGIVRDVFGRGNDFCQKITYRTTGAKPDDLLQAFRNSVMPRVVVTVDMIATGTDIKPLEIVMFMREVKSRNFFEQMKGRGVRVISDVEFQAVTPDANHKDHFVLIDCVGVTEIEMTDSPPLERVTKTVSFDALMQQIAYGSIDPDIISSLAGRLARLQQSLSKHEHARIEDASGGQPLNDIVSTMIEALDPDRQFAAAQLIEGKIGDEPPSDDALAQARATILSNAVMPLAANPILRDTLSAVKRSQEQTIDDVSKDEVTLAGYSQEAKDRALAMVTSFELYLEEHKDEIGALQVLYNRPYGSRLLLKDIKQLAEAIQAPPRSWTLEKLWHAYETLDKSKVRGSGTHMLTDLVSLVRHALEQEPELTPFKDSVNTRFDAWLAQQEQGGRRFTAEQRRWLDDIRDHVASSLQIETEDFAYSPFNQRGGLGKVYELFGDDLPKILEELNEVLVA